jgi:DNA processing protein
MMGRALDIVRIDIDSADYPSQLREIKDPPAQLYCSGDISLLHDRSVAVVGSRKFTMYGRTVAMMIGRRLAECGVTVVSGLAIGIDAFAHKGALEVPGKVIGVLGGGILQMGPRCNYDLMMKGLAAGGLVVSEYEPDMPAAPHQFPQRNRIISGLAQSVAVVEARVSSGSLITAQFAAEQGRSVYAVPGNINSQFSIGSNLLIRDGAYPLIIIDDIIRDLGIEYEPQREVAENLDADERKVYDSVAAYNGISADKLCLECGMTAAKVNAIITVMEIKGVLQSYGGKIYLAK